MGIELQRAVRLFTRLEKWAELDHKIYKVIAEIAGQQGTILLIHLCFPNSPNSTATYEGKMPIDRRRTKLDVLKWAGKQRAILGNGKVWAGLIEKLFSEIYEKLDEFQAQEKRYK
jgi:hypothetical protein